MSEKFRKKEKFNDNDEEYEYNYLISRAKQDIDVLTDFERRALFNLLMSRASRGVDVLSHQEYELLIKFGYYYLNKDNIYSAIQAFKATQDFEELRKVTDYLLRERPDSFDLPYLLIDLEDHEGIRNLLNREDIKLPTYAYEELFEPLKEALWNYIENFLRENKISIATGIINQGIDLIAIWNLVKEYDIAVPIARGGLNQGAIAHLWGMPTRILDIAAHGLKRARGKWVSSVSAEDFEGKRVLLFDKDAVTGASARKAVDMLKKYHPESIGIYFAYPVLRPGTIGGVNTSGLPEGLEIFSPHNASIKNAGEVYIEAHERLETLYGRRRKMERQFIEEAERLRKQFPELAESLKIFALKQFSVFDSLNPKLAGVERIREIILKSASELYQEHKIYLEGKLYDLPGVLDNFRKVLEKTPLLPPGFESEIIKARYSKQIEEAARRRNIEKIHYPINPLAAFNTAQKAAREGFDVALIVGPEGFAYEPYFQDLGIQTVAVNIPESGRDEVRIIKLFDNLAELQGKKVLVVEDDVRTGKTLQKLLEILEPYNPKKLGLYLEQPQNLQATQNIPQRFETVYVAEESTTASKEFIDYLGSRNLKIFKNPRMLENIL